MLFFKKIFVYIEFQLIQEVRWLFNKYVSIKFSLKKLIINNCILSKEKSVSIYIYFKILLISRFKNNFIIVFFSLERLTCRNIKRKLVNYLLLVENYWNWYFFIIVIIRKFEKRFNAFYYLIISRKLILVYIFLLLFMIQTIINFHPSYTNEQELRHT